MRLPVGVFIMCLAVFTGFLSGTGAFILKWMIRTTTDLLTSGINGASVWYIFIPIAGICLTGLYQRKILRRNIEHGSERLVADYVKQNYNIHPSGIYAPLLASTLTLGFGGSAGSEGPIAFSGAAIGSNVGRLFRLSQSQMRSLVAIGASCGIAGIFKSPVGGAFFALEFMRVGFDSLGVIALFCGCIVSAMTAYLWSGCTPDVAFVWADVFEPSIIPAVLLLGVFCGVYGCWYRYFGERTRSLLESISRPWLRNIVSGTLLGLLVCEFPIYYGEGYGVIGGVINQTGSSLLEHTFFSQLAADHWVLLALVGVVLIFKGAATNLTNSGGGVAGDFAPTLFAGCLAGYFFAGVCNGIFGISLDPGVFALVGMAATMSAIIRAPLMSIFITAEATWNYEFFLPLVLASATAYMMSLWIMPRKKV